MATILIIEDDRQFARLVDKILVPRGHQVIHAPNAMEGIHLTENTPVDLVLLDMDLPDLDGKVVATTLRGRPATREVPIIAVTAQNDATTRRLTKAFGCNAFIPKPIDTRSFPGQIGAFLPDEDTESSDPETEEEA